MSVRNPLDYLRVMWWNFFQPRKIDDLWDPPSGLPQTETRRAFLTIERWLVAKLLWLPYLIAVLAFGFLLSRPAEALWILAPMVPIWVLSIVVTVLVYLPDPSETSGCLMSISYPFYGLSMLGWAAFTMYACVAAVAAKHPLSAILVIGAAMLSSSIGYGMYRAMIYPTLPQVTRTMRPRLPLEHLKTFVLQWWVHTGMLTILICFMLAYVVDVNSALGPDFLFLAASVGPVVLSYLVAAGTGRVLSEDGAGALGAAARAVLFIILVGCYAVLIWILGLGGWKMF